MPAPGDSECAAAPAFCIVLKRKSLQFSLLPIGQKNLTKRKDEKLKGFMLVLRGFWLNLSNLCA